MDRGVGSAKKSEDLDRIVQLVDSIFPDCEQEIRNAVTVSFLENIDPDDVVGREIFNALPPELQQQWFALDQYVLKLVGKSLRGSVARNAKTKA